MLKIKSKQLGVFIGDILVSLLSLFVALSFRFIDLPDNDRLYAHIQIFVPIFLLLIALYFSFDFYDFSPFSSRLRQLSRIINIHLFTALVGFGYFYLFSNYTEITPKTVLVLYTVFQILFSSLFRILLVPIFFKSEEKSKALLIADEHEYRELKDFVNKHSYFSFYFVDHINVEAEELKEKENSIKALQNILEENNIKQVVIDIRDGRVSHLLPILYNLASQRKIYVFDGALVYQDILKKMPTRGIGHFWFFESVRLNVISYEAVKRFIDIVISLPFIVLYMFIFPFVYIAIKLEDGKEIFSIQKRYGRGGKIINLYKIRTMEFTDEGEWVLQNKTNKVTKVGAFLRKTRLDEFPQLFNVLKGDISLVGPRPDILANGGKLSASVPFYMMRYTVLPGLSGWAQVSQELPPNSLEETKVRLQYDLYYVKNRSLLLDLIIMIKTFRVLVMRTGI